MLRLTRTPPFSLPPLLPFPVPVFSPHFSASPRAVYPFSHRAHPPPSMAADPNKKKGRMVHVREEEDLYAPMEPASPLTHHMPDDEPDFYTEMTLEELELSVPDPAPAALRGGRAAGGAATST